MYRTARVKGCPRVISHLKKQPCQAASREAHGSWARDILQDRFDPLDFDFQQFVFPVEAWHGLSRLHDEPMPRIAGVPGAPADPPPGLPPTAAEYSSQSEYIVTFRRRLRITRRRIV